VYIGGMSTQVAKCNACRYDLAGQHVGWTHQCPIEGTCPECGHTFRWSEAFSAGSRLRWAFELPGVSGIALRRWWATTWRVVQPSLFWRELGNEKVVPGRLVRWFALMLIQLHLINLAIALVRRTINVMQWSTPQYEHPFWRSPGERFRMLGAPYLGIEELTRYGNVETMFFADRFRAALACGSLAVGMMLFIMTLSGITYRRASLARACVYGMMPLAFMYAYAALYGFIAIVVESVFRFDAAWWYGRRDPFGKWNLGASAWLTRLVNAACATWLMWWWWCSVRAVFPTCGRWLRVLAILIALITTGLLYVRYLNYWDLWESI